jgi:hypothetical protein
MNHWHQYAFGHLPDGSRVMLALVEAGLTRRRFPAVLVCRADGLYRLWRSGRSQLLAPGYSWTNSTGWHSSRDVSKSEASDTVPRWDAEKSLVAHAPQAWGRQDGSAGVIKHIPDWLLRARTDNLARVLLAWFWIHEALTLARLRRVDIELQPGSLLAKAPLWRPVAITLLPNTDVVVRAVHSGVLLQRLKAGMERIYISEMAWIRVPKLQATLRALAKRFPKQLVLVKAQSYGLWAQALKVARVRACEYQFIGAQLQDRYEEDYGYEKYYNTAPLQGMLRLRVGDIPRGTQLLWLHQMPVDFAVWDALDVDGMLGIEKLAAQRRAVQSQRASNALAQPLQRQGEDKGAGEDDRVGCKSDVDSSTD